MKKFRVVASFITYCETEIEAENMDEAYEIALNMDGGSFDPMEGAQDDWSIDEVEELQ